MNFLKTQYYKYRLYEQRDIRPPFPLNGNRRWNEKDTTANCSFETLSVNIIRVCPGGQDFGALPRHGRRRRRDIFPRLDLGFSKASPLLRVQDLIYRGLIQGKIEVLFFYGIMFSKDFDSRGLVRLELMRGKFLPSASMNFGSSIVPDTMIPKLISANACSPIQAVL